MRNKSLFDNSLGLVLFCLIFAASGLAFWAGFFNVYFAPYQALGAGTTQTASTTVVVGNAAPTIAAITLNGGSDITLTANTTTVVYVNVTASDNNGCADITNSTATIMMYRSGYTSSTCLSTPNNLNCYRATAFTATSSCQNSVTVNTTTSFDVYYFAQATDASSSFVNQNWLATVIVQDTSYATGTMDSTGVELLTLVALNVTTSSINYGTLSASSTTGGTNQNTTTTNAGNASTTLQLSANSTLTSGNNSISTTSQKYATSTFIVNTGSTSTALLASPTTVPGFLLTSPTSTTNVNGLIFWGLHVPAGTATGTYNGVNLFTAAFQP